MIPQVTPVVSEPGPCKRCGKPQAVSLVGVNYCPPCDRESREETIVAVSAYHAAKEQRANA